MTCCQVAMRGAFRGGGGSGTILYRVDAAARGALWLGGRGGGAGSRAPLRAPDSGPRGGHGGGAAGPD
eukprot:1147749-Prorocentrum_minimum.AAC.1